MSASSHTSFRKQKNKFERRLTQYTNMSAPSNMTAVTSFENTISDTGLLRENDHEGGWKIYSR